MLNLNMRKQVRSESSATEWVSSETTRGFEPIRVALLLCDMWNTHWCVNSANRVSEMAPVMNRAVNNARNLGMQIIHAPSDAMKYYADYPQRLTILDMSQIAPPPEKILPKEPPLPIDDSDGGCDTPIELQIKTPDTSVWTRQHPEIEIFENDVISDSGKEVYSLLKLKGIGLLLIMGVHTNMCVLGRSFGIRQMLRWGVECALVRDMTDTMYNPAMRPFVSHFEGTRLVVEHIERYCCPTLLSSDFSGETPFQFDGNYLA